VVAGINTWTLSSWRVFRLFHKIQKELLIFLFQWKISIGPLPSIIMVIPNAHNRHLFLNILMMGILTVSIQGALQFLFAFTVSVDNISAPHTRIWFHLKHLLPRALGSRWISRGGESEPGDFFDVHQALVVRCKERKGEEGT